MLIIWQLFFGVIHSSFAQVGKNGALTVTAASTVVNSYASIRMAGGVTGAVSLDAGSTTINHDGTVAFAPGDLVMIIQVQGGNSFSINQATSSTAYGSVSALGNAGLYEFRIVSSAPSTTSFTITSGLTNTYVSTTLTGPGNNNRAQVVKVPRYSSLTVNAGASIVPAAWDGNKGGVVALEVTGTTTVNGTISASGFGFRGGIVQNYSTATIPLANPDYAFSDRARGAAKGESVAGSTTFNAAGTVTGTLPGGTIYGRGAAANGGGGGNSHNAGGGGGANAAASTAATWTGQGVMCSSCTGTGAWALDPGYLANANTRTNSPGGGRGGYTYSSVNADALVTGPNNSAWSGDNRQERGGLGGRPLATTPQSRIFMGGGGGAGDSNDNKGTSGGNGGGIVYVLSNAVTGTGTIEANGNAALNTAASGNDAPGGGGGGGTLIVKTTTLNTQVKLIANGGKGGDQVIPGPEAEGPGGGGGGGYIAFSGGTPSTITVTGASNGTTNSSALTEFPANGATSGNTGHTSSISSTDMPIASTDLSLTHTKTPGPYYVGQSVTITLQVSNAGQTEATNVLVSGALPAGLTPMNVTLSAGSFNALNQWVISNLAANATATLTITATISPNTTNNPDFYTSIGNVAGYQYDSNFTNNSTVVTLASVNQAPIITSNGGGATATIPVAENTTAVTTVTSTDAENNARTYSIAGGADASKFNVNATTGALTFIAAPNFEAPGSAAGSNTYAVIVRVTDNGTGNLSDEQAITVIVTNVNEAPVAINVTNVGTIYSTSDAVPITTLDGNDGETATGAPAYFRIVTLPASGTLTVNNQPIVLNQNYPWSQRNTLKYDPIDSQNGNVTFTYTVVDAEGAIDETPATYTIPVTYNQRPVAVNISSQTMLNTDGATDLNVNVFPTDDGTIASFRVVNLPNSNQGVLYINNAVAVAGQNYPVNYVLVNGSYVPYLNIKFDPAVTNTADVVIDYAVTDNLGARSNTAQYTIQIQGVPVADAIVADPIPSTAGATLIKNLSATDLDGTIKGYQFTTLPTLVQGALTVNGIAAVTSKVYTVAELTNLLRFDPSGNMHGNVVFSYIAIDNEDVQSSAVTYTIPVTNVAPVANNVLNTATLLTTASNVILAPSLNATDDGVISKFLISTLPTHGTLRVNGTIVSSTTQEFNWVDRNNISYTHTNATVTADATFQYLVKDAEGLSSNSATYTIPINGAPVARNVVTQTILNTAGTTTLVVTPGSYPTDDVNIVNSSIIFTSVPDQSTQGTLRVGNSAVVANTLYPAMSFAGGVSFTPVTANLNDVVFNYKVVDGEGAESDLATFTIPINGEPVAEDVTHSPAIISTADATLLNPLKGNDGEGANGLPTSFRIATLPASGILTVNDQAIVIDQVYPWSLRDKLKYDPADETVTGNIIFTYSVGDIEDAWDATPATYTIPVTYNQRPIAKNFSFPKMLNTDPAKVLGLPTAVPEDDGGVTALKFRFLSLPGDSQGTLLVGGIKLNTTTEYGVNTFIATNTFDPAVGNFGDVVLRYVAIDAYGAVSNEATITIPINGEPVAVNQTNVATLASGADRTILDALNGTDDISVSSFRFTVLPTAAQGVLYVNGVAANTTASYPWSSYNKISFDPRVSNISDVSFIYVIKDNEVTEDKSPAVFTIKIIADADLDGITDAYDLDADNDGIPDAMEGTDDKDGDGIPNHLDLDSDGDGILDAVEANGGKVPSATVFSLSLGRYTSASGANGLVDILETAAGSGTINYVVTNTDNDVVYDFLDIDSDNDGILDNLEAQATGSRLLPAGIDTDGDGIDDRYDASCGCAVNATTITPLDTDGDGTPDYRDMDSDNDLMTDTEEAYDLNKDGKSVDDLLAMAEVFRNNAGITAAKDYYVDGTAANPPAWLKQSGPTKRILSFQISGNTYYRDTDGDGLIDLFDSSNYGMDRSTSLNTAFRQSGTVTPLPVTLISFTARVTKAGVVLDWATATEQNNDYFIIERSLDGRNFVQLNQVDGAGNSNSRINYTYLDATAPMGTVYYRLKQVDFDGKSDYSKMVAVEVQKQAEASIMLYPNPAADVANLDLTTMPAGTCTVRVISMNGRVVQQFKVQAGAVNQLDVATLATGKYVLQVQGAQHYQVISFIKK
ncbi:T9SS type A sorting domain-containing protein [uncultured Pontibacter sp.]|uniref:T9SS type A sorting domain-containing protein n=1 Tax=uncultured Pontibacter sp. TaxID=453356 RepID=UPI002619EB96|nr:T9SS type A sorting domain-containing protein [uncultured Pontibacter sp.]